MPQHPLAQLAQYIFGAVKPDPDIDEAKRVVAEWPPAKEMLDKTTIGRSQALGDFVAKTSGDGWNDPKQNAMAGHGRSSAFPLNKIGLKPFVNISPDDPYPVDTLAHELGHVQQGEYGLPIRNDDAADNLLWQLSNLRRMREQAQPEPLRNAPFAPNMADMIQNVMDKTKSWPLK